MLLPLTPLTPFTPFTSSINIIKAFVMFLRSLPDFAIHDYYVLFAYMSPLVVYCLFVFLICKCASFYQVDEPEWNGHFMVDQRKRHQRQKQKKMRRRREKRNKRRFRQAQKSFNDDI